MIYIVDCNVLIAKCIKKATARPTKNFTNAIDCMNEISKGNLPTLIFLEILLDGPDGFTFLNELVSYTDTAEIPVVIVSSIDFKNQDLSSYGIVGILNKEEMTPINIKEYVEKYA